MNLITRILAIDVPAGTALQFPPELTFRGFTLGWLILLLLVMMVGMGAVVFFNLLEKGTLGIIRRIILIGLRAALLLLLLFLIMRPVLLAEFKGERAQGVALLIDNSQSMQQRDRRLTDQDKARVAIAMGLRSAKEPLSEKIGDLPPDVLSGGKFKDPSRRDLVLGLLKHPELKLLDDLQKFGPLRPYLFGADARALQDSEAVKKELADKIIDAYKAGEGEGRTSLADSILKILNSKDGDPPSAIVVITDGQDNASKFTLREAAEACAKKGVPLHIIGAGSSEAGQLQLKEVLAPDTLFAEDNVAIPIRWRAQGFKQGNLGSVEIVSTLAGREVIKRTINPQTGEMVTTFGGKEIARKKLELPVNLTGEDLRDILSFEVPKDLPKSIDKGDSHDLVTTIKYKAGTETFTDKITQSVRVPSTKIRVLYVEHSPRWEFKFLQPALMRDRRIHNNQIEDPNNPEKKKERLFLLVNAAKEIADKAPYLPEFPKTREKFLEAKYDLIILGDVASSYFSKEQQEWIKEFVQKGGGLIVMSGRQNMPSSYEKTPIAELLPIEFKKEKSGPDADVRTRDYPPTLTAEGQRTDWLALADTPEENLKVWQKDLQGFHWNYPAYKLKSAATSLIVNPRMKIGEAPEQEPMPILATHYAGKGQVIWLGTDETWRWRWNYQDKYFVRFWGQLIYQAGLPHMLRDGAKRVQMALEHSQATLNKPSKIFVRIVDKDFNPRKDATVTAELEFLDAKVGEERRTEVKLTAINLKDRPGEYSYLLTHDRPGRINLTVKNPEANTFSYRVELPPKHELEEAGLAENALREAAKISGGRFYREEDLHALTEDFWGVKAKLKKAKDELKEVTETLKTVDKTEANEDLAKKKKDLGEKQGRLQTEVTELSARSAVPSKSFSRRQEVLLWNPLAILLFLGLLTTEWLVRKFSDLS